MWKPTLIFLGLTAVLSSIFYVVINVTGSGNPWVLMLMWMPALAAILTLKILGRPLSTLGLGRWSTKYAWIGYLVPIVYCLAVSVVIWLFGWGGFPNSEFLGAWADQAGVAALPEWVLVPLFVIAMGTTGMLGGTAAALGEEIGWRGFLVPQLYRHLPFLAVSLLSGVIWAAWHYAITGVIYRDFALPPWYWITTFTLSAVAISFLSAWLRLKSGSIWPAVFLHASHNLFMQSVFTPLTTRKELTDWMGGDLGVVFTVAALIVAIVTYFGFRKRLPSPQEFEAMNA
jgi:uncharacterized protein